jgi:predicted MFS family arabinose efflux permease
VIWCEWASAASLLLVYLALLLGTWHIIFLATFFSAMLSQLSQPAGMKLYKKHVPSEQAQSGVALLQSLFAIFTVLGPSIGTFVYQTFGIYMTLFIAFIMFVFSSFALMFIPADQNHHPQMASPSVMKDMLAGIRHIFSNKVLTLLSGCVAAVGCGVGLISPLSLFVVTEKLGLAAEKLQWLTIPYGAGEIIGGFITIAAATQLSPQLLLAIGLLVNGFGIWGVGHSTNLVLTMLLQFLIGLTQPCIFIGITTLTMQCTEEAWIGRVMGVRTLLMTGTMVVMMGLAGQWKTQVSLASIYSISASLFMIALILTIPIFTIAKREGRECC